MENSSRILFRHTLTLVLMLVLAGGMAACATGAIERAKLVHVASFDHQVTGVTVSEDGRIFVSFPRWNEDVPVSVAEVTAEGVTPYPNAAWNEWRNSRKTLGVADHFVCVQSVVVDHQNNLWVLDPAAPNNERLLPGGPKLVKVNLEIDQVQDVVYFGDRVAPQGTYLNDVRFSPDGHYAYVTDSGKGAILVVDLATKSVRRALDGEPSTQAEESVVIKSDGKELRRPDGRALKVHADGIALSANGEYLYWQALTGTTLYRVPTAILHDSTLTSADVAKHVEVVGHNGVSDGLWIDAQDRMYVSALEENAVKLRHSIAPGSAPPIVLVKDEALRWPDSFSQGPDGSIYVTTSRIQDSRWFNPEAPARLETDLWRLDR